MYKTASLTNTPQLQGLQSYKDLNRKGLNITMAKCTNAVMVFKDAIGIRKGEKMASRILKRFPTFLKTTRV